MKKVILTAAVSAALLFALVAGTAGVPTVQEEPAGVKVQCAGCMSGHYASLPLVW
jgi:hypothetical protein